MLSGDAFRNCLWSGTGYNTDVDRDNNVSIG